MNAQPTWQRVPAGYYVDPITLRDAQLAQSAATVGGVVAPFRYGRSREPIAECHNLPESEPRVRGFTAEQERAMYASECAPEPINDYAARRGE